MDSSPQSASFTSDEFTPTLPDQQEEEIEVEGEHHIHLPNPSYWPIYLSLAIAISMAGVLVISSAPWVSLIAVVFVFICILGLALENPMAPIKEKFVTVYQKSDPWKFKLGQNVVDAQGRWLGKVQARFRRYILVERGGLVPKVYYVPQSASKEPVTNNTVILTLSEDDLLRMGLNRLPNDLYDESPEAGFPTVRGAAQFARRPLSPAETGHYNYGKNWPGINTDASGSYHPEEVRPKPQDYVTEAVYTTEKSIPPRVISPD